MGKNIIHVMIGTKGQLTKMSPVLRELDKRGIPYNFIRTGQHAGIIDHMLETYHLRKPDYEITKRKKDIENFYQGIMWAISCLFRGIINRTKVWKGKKGIVLVHGDTESTLISVILARLSGIRVAHVEAGLRSFSIFQPFPEEIIRRVTSVFSHYMFAPGEWACNNIRKKYPNRKIIDTRYNTALDTVRHTLQATPTMELPKGEYVIFAIHRKETLYVEQRFKKAIHALELIAAEHKVIFILHKNTEYTLKNKGYLDELRANDNIEFKHYYDHISFMHLVKKCIFAATDGGSLQEETFFLDKPYLILRERTERQEGLGQTAYISGVEAEKVKYFLANYNKFKRNEKIEEISPSQIVVDELLKIMD